MNILITGIHGFVGSNLVKALSPKHTLYGLDIVQPTKEGIAQTYGWNELEKLPAIDAIIHLAGKAHDTKNEAVAQTYFDINLGLTQQIYDYFLQSGGQKFIFFSSVKAAADRVEGVLTEEVIPTPIGPYGESKIAAENYLLSKPVVEKEVVILRPCMIHGPGNKGNLNLLYQIIKKGMPWPLGAYENRRSFVSIDNLTFIIGKMMEQPVETGIYHMADDEALSTNELIEVMCEAMNKKATIWKISKRVMATLAAVGTTLHLPLNSERLQKLTENYEVSNQKIKRALQIEKMPTKAQEGFTKTIQSFNQS
ncbi:MAG: NAD-dependent epimerase/dehydratase family protein [Phocaeicola sp.]